MDRSNSPIWVSEGLASQLNSSLPIYVSAADVNKYPDLSRLLEDLTHRLTPTGMTKTTHNELTHATHSLKHSRQKYLEETTFHRLVQDVVYQNPKTLEGNMALKEAEEVVTLSEVQNHLQLLNITSENGIEKTGTSDGHGISEKQFVFGITPELIIARVESRISNTLIEEVSNQIEKRLIDEWTKIAAFHDPVGFLQYESEEVKKIPDQLELSSRNVASERKKLAHSVIQTDFLYFQIWNHLLEYGNLLKKVMSKQRLCHYPSKHTESIYIQLSALLMKLKCVELEILLSTYTSTSVPALKLIHSHIMDRLPKAESSLARLKHELSSFDGLDSRFKALLNEHAQIKADIEVFKPLADSTK